VQDGGNRRGAGRPRPPLQPSGEDALALGRRCWPGLELDPAAFARFAQAAGLEPGAAGAGDALLAYACAAGVPAAVALFEEHMVPAARRAIARVQPSPSAVDETVQRFRLKLLVGPSPAIARFRGRSPLRAWLRVAATRMALDDLRRQHAGDRPVDTLADRLIAGALDPELGLLVASVQDVVRATLSKAIQQLPLRDRNLLRMHFEDGLSIDRLAAPAGVHRATIARWLRAACDRVAAAVQHELGTRHPELGSSSLDSLMRAVRSRLDIDLSWLFAGQLAPSRETPPRC
jgi:RNA polymerase sigma-70 factor (ECF subfamily)